MQIKKYKNKKIYKNTYFRFKLGESEETLDNSKTCQYYKI